MVKVRVIKHYFDKVRDEYPEMGTEFDVKEERANLLIGAGVCELVVEEQNEKKDNASSEKPKKETKKTEKKVKAEA